MAKNKTYDKISRPYGGYLERSGDMNLSPEVEPESGTGAGTVTPGGGGSGTPSETPVDSEQSFSNIWIDNKIRSKNWKPKKFGFMIDGETGYAEFANLYITGAITVITGGTVGGWTITADALTSGNVTINSTNEQILMGAATAPLTGVGVFLGLDGADYEFRAGNPAGNYIHWDASTLTVIGTISGSIAAGDLTGTVPTGTLGTYTNDWIFDGNWTLTDLNTVDWGAGTLTLSDATTYSIDAGDTGNMAAKTFIYLDTGVSSTVLQTSTTETDAIGVGKLLIAIAQDGTVEPTLLVLNSDSMNIDATSIVAGSITANEILTGTITANEIVGTTLSAIYADLGTITAGSINIGSGEAIIASDGKATFKDITISNRIIGIDSAAELTAAISTLTSAGGGTIRLAAGSYVLSSTEALPSSIRLEGDDSSTTTIVFVAGANFTMTGTDVYTTGTCSITQGTVALAGQGTTWTADMVGRQVFLSNRWYVIAAFGSTTSLTLASGYADATITTGTYRISDVIKNVSFERLTIVGASTTKIIDAIDIRDLYISECALVSSGAGGKCLEVDNGMRVSTQKASFIGVPATTSNGIDVTNGSFINMEETASVSHGGSGVSWNNVSVSQITFSAANANTGDGYNLTDVTTSYFIIEVSGNGGQGVELVSGCDNSRFILNAIGNTSDGLKATATSDYNLIVNGVFTGNGGYGVNLAASTVDNSNITANSFVGNASGAVNDSGTGTLIRGNIGIDDNAVSGISARNTCSASGTEQAGPTSGAGPPLTWTRMATIQVNAIGTVRTQYEMKKGDV